MMNWRRSLWMLNNLHLAFVFRTWHKSPPNPPRSAKPCVFWVLSTCLQQAPACCTELWRSLWNFFGSFPYLRILYWLCLEPEKIFSLPLHLLGFSSFYRSCLKYLFLRKAFCGYLIGGPSLEVTFWCSTPFISFKVLIIVSKYFGYLFTYLSAICLLLYRIKSVFSRPGSFLFNSCACCLARCLACRGT